MCRAIWVIVFARDERAPSIRRAIGPDAQVVLVTADVADPAIRSAHADAVVIDATTPGARDLPASLAAEGVAVLWVGDDAPQGAHHAVPPSDDLSGALTRALLNRG